MVELLVILGSSGLLAIAAVLAARDLNARQWQRELVAYSLRFPRGVQPGAVTTFVAGLSGLVAPYWKRPFVTRAVGFETWADETGIGHHLVVPKSRAQLALNVLRAAVPGVVVRPDEKYRAVRPGLAVELALSDQRRPLNTDQAAAVASTMLANLQPLRDGERMIVQWLASPVGPLGLVPAARKRPSNSTLLSRLWAGVMAHEHDPEAVKAARAKQSSPMSMAVGRVGVVAADQSRQRALLMRALAAFHLANAPGVHLRRRWLPRGRVARALAERRLPLATAPCMLNAAELASLIGFPVGDLSLPGLLLGGTRQLAPARDIPSGGRVIAQSTFPGNERPRPLALSVTDSLRHLHVIGPTGVGKSTLLLNLVAQDMAAGRGVVLIDPGDLVNAVLDRVPTARQGDVVVIDPADDEKPIGINPLAGSSDSAELMVEQLIGTLHQMFASFWGPRTDDILRAALLTLVSRPRPSLTDLPLLLTDLDFRRRLVGGIDDPVLMQFWGWFQNLSDAERAQVIAAPMNKLRAFLLRRRLRNILGQAEPLFDFDRALAERKIVLVSTAKGLIGEESSTLFGSLVVGKLWQAIQKRAGVEPGERRPTFCYVDECQDYLRLPVSLADLLTQARGLAVGLVLAHQHLGQLPHAVRDAVMANARSKAIFQLAADDARVFARELAPHLTAADLQGLGAYEVVLTLSVGSRVAPPVTAVTYPPPPTTGQAEVVRRLSRERYGIAREQVEAAIRARQEARPGGGRVGRREVPS